MTIQNKTVTDESVKDASKNSHSWTHLGTCCRAYSIREFVFLDVLLHKHNFMSLFYTFYINFETNVCTSSVICSINAG